MPQQDLDHAEAELEVAKADLDAANAALVNAKLTEEVGVMLATAEIAGAKAAVADAELSLGYCTITAPMDGMIGRKAVSIGNLVGRGESTVLATLSTVDPIRASFTISEQDYIRLRRAGKDGKQPPLFRLTLADGTDYPEDGTFVVTEREVDPQTGTLVVEARFPNPNGLLRPGQFGRVRVVAETIEGAVVIPRIAVMEQQSSKIVYVVKEDKTVGMRPVELGVRHGDLVVVRKGVKAGEPVIIEGMLKARPGQPVDATEGKAGKPVKPEGDGK